VIVASSSGAAAILQWGDLGNHPSGTYDSFREAFNNTQPGALADHCAVSGTVVGSSVTVRLSGCTDASSNGTYAGQLRGSNFDLELPTTSGTLATVVFKPGTISSYNTAVSGVRLLIEQTGGLQSYLTSAQPSGIFFQPTESAFFKIGTTWYDVVTQQTNVAGNHAQAIAKLFVLRWFNHFWSVIASFPLSSNTGPIPGTPTAIDFEHNITAYAVGLTWMTYKGWEVVARLNGEWHEVPFDADTKLAADLSFSSVSMTFRNGKATESIRGCVGSICPSSPAVITYTFNAHSAGGPIFAVTGLSGPAVYFRS